MTKPTLERAARALADHFGCEWETMREADRETITGYCRAVLMAVRVPDKDIMESAFHDVLEPVYPTDFTRVCDAILAEGE